MKIDAQITMLFNDDGLTIEIRDYNASVTFVDIHMTSEQVCQAFSRLAHTPVESCEIRGVEYIGKVMENKRFEFQLPPKSTVVNRKELACQALSSECPEGWEPSNSFSSQDSFFSKDGKEYARTTIRRWVDKEQ